VAGELTLYLIRHGIAEERGANYPDDSKRPLTAEGKSRIRDIGLGLIVLGVELDEILTSPFVRTRQTAEILSQSWPKPPQVTDLEALAVGGRNSAVLASLASYKERQEVALIGHMPGIGVLASELVGAGYGLDFKKGAVACIGLERTPGRGAGKLLWFAPPRMLRMIAKEKE
jgi:phosphohistidine phosphatase